jgi:hypothetical protein
MDVRSIGPNIVGFGKEVEAPGAQNEPNGSMAGRN